MIPSPIDSLLKEYNVNETDSRRIRADLERIRKKDLETYAHSIRTTFLSVELAKFFGLNPKAFVYAAPRHDYGKVHVEDRVLKKKGRFTSSDRVKMSTHPLYAFNHTKQDNPFSALLEGMHHMHNAEPYPAELPLGKSRILREKEADAKEYSKVLAIADWWDAAVNRKNSRTVPEKLTLEFLRAEMKKGLPKLGKMIDRLFEEGFFNETKLQIARARKRALVNPLRSSILRRMRSVRQAQKEKEQMRKRKSVARRMH